MAPLLNPFMRLVERVRTFLHDAAATIPDLMSHDWVVGVSGGPDSLALLHLLVRGGLVEPSRLVVAHLDHGLRPQAGAEALFVQETAQAWGVRCVVRQVNVPELAQTEGWTLEEAARRARYQFLGEVAQEVNAAAILLAHHADDQVETVLMHLLRGSGLAGLRGILPIAPFPFTIDDLRFTIDDSPFPPLLRPFLTTTRPEIEAYCQEHNLTPMQDESNQDTRFLRNRIRHELLPLLETYNPQIRGRILDLAELVKADEAFLRSLQEELRPQLGEEQDGFVEINRARWLALPLSMRRRTLRQVLEPLLDGEKELPFAVLERARQLMETGTVGQQMDLPGQVRLVLGYEVVSFAAATALIPFSFPQLPDDQPIPLPVPGEVVLPNGWVIRAESVQAVNLDEIRRNPDPWQAFVAVNEGEQLWLRPRRPGERIQPLGLQGHSQTLKKVMNERQIPAPARGRWPILATDQHLLWLVGHVLDNRAQIREVYQIVLRVRVGRTDE